MRRAMVIGAAVLVLLALVGIGVGVYNAGVHDGVAQGLQQSGETTQVVRVIGGGYRHGYGWGFFPFGFFLFPLVVIGFFLLLRAAFWGGRWGGPWRGGPYGRGWGGPGPWGPGGPQRYEEWHRRQHEQRPDEHPTTTGERTTGDQADL
jgi:hypothetical protein